MNTEILWSVVFASIVVETIVNTVRAIEAEVKSTSRGPGKFYWVALGTGLVIGLVVTLNYDIDIFKLVGLEGRVPIMGAILTGLVASRGANVVSDLLERLNSWKR